MLIKKQLIKKHQLGGPIAKLSQTNPSGSWGNRGEGNELQSAAENATSWVWDKVSNAGDYLDQGLAYITGLLPGGMSAEEAVEDTKNKQEAFNMEKPGYVNHFGEYKYFPQTGAPITLPTLPANASSKLRELHDKLKKARKSLIARESQLKHNIGNKKGTALEKTKTHQRYEASLKEYNDALTEFDVVPYEAAVFTDKKKKLVNSPAYKSKVREQEKKLASKKDISVGDKIYNDGDRRHANPGRPPQAMFNYLDNTLANTYSGFKRKLAESKETIERYKRQGDKLRLNQAKESQHLLRLMYARKYPNIDANKAYNWLEFKFGDVLDKWKNNAK